MKKPISPWCWLALWAWHVGAALALLALLVSCLVNPASAADCPPHYTLTNRIPDHAYEGTQYDWSALGCAGAAAWAAGTGADVFTGCSEAGAVVSFHAGFACCDQWDFVFTGPSCSAPPPATTTLPNHIPPQTLGVAVGLILASFVWVVFR